MTVITRLFLIAMRRALIALPLLVACGYAGAAENECFPSFPGGFPETFLSKPNIAVVMRIDGGLISPSSYVDRVTKDPEQLWTDEFRNEFRENFRGENRFDDSSEFLVLKSIKGDLDPIIVFHENPGAINSRTGLGKLLLIAFEDIQPDGTLGDGYSWDNIYYQQFPLSMNSNSYNESSEFKLPLNCEWIPIIRDDSFINLHFPLEEQQEQQ